MGDQLGDFVLGATIVERAGEMALELFVAAHRHQRAANDEAAVTLRQMRAFPNLAIDQRVGDLGEFRHGAADVFARG